jgi:hypothetical protein
MRIHVLRSTWVLVLAVFTPRAFAFIDTPYISPSNPDAGTTISVNSYRGVCDVLNIGIVPPAIEQHGANITILFTGIHEDDPEFCYYGTGTETYPIGAFPPGSYTLDVKRRYDTFSGWVTQTLGVIPFTVAGVPPQAPVEAPATGDTSLAVLLMTLTSMAWLALRQRSRQSR